MTAKLRLRPWKPGDETAFTPRPDFAREAQMAGWDWAAGAPGPTWTVCRWTGEVVGVGGFNLADAEKGEWTAWANLSDLPRRDWPQLLWLAGVTIRGFAMAKDAVIDTLVRSDFAAAARCMERVGFVCTDLLIRGRGGNGYSYMRWVG